MMLFLIYVECCAAEVKLSISMLKVDNFQYRLIRLVNRILI
jgi:hypothetical protein